MVDGKLFDIVATLADRLRKKTDKPFGGMQVNTVSSTTHIYVFKLTIY